MKREASFMMEKDKWNRHGKNRKEKIGAMEKNLNSLKKNNLNRLKVNRIEKVMYLALF